MFKIWICRAGVERRQVLIMYIVLLMDNDGLLWSVSHNLHPVSPNHPNFIRLMYSSIKLYHVEARVLQWK